MMIKLLSSSITGCRMDFHCPFISLCYFSCLGQTSFVSPSVYWWRLGIARGSYYVVLCNYMASSRSGLIWALCNRLRWKTNDRRVWRTVKHVHEIYRSSDYIVLFLLVGYQILIPGVFPTAGIQGQGPPHLVVYCFGCHDWGLHSIRGRHRLRVQLRWPWVYYGWAD